MLLDNGSPNLNRERREQNREAVLAVPQHPPALDQDRHVQSPIQLAIGLLRDFSSSVLGGSRMVRLVGPHDRPLERHEFESRDVSDVRYTGRGWL